MRCYIFFFREIVFPITARGNTSGHAWRNLLSAMPECEAYSLKTVEVL